MAETRKTWTAAVILLVQTGTLFLYTPSARPAPSSEAEKLILGFERQELNRGTQIARQEKPGRDSWFYLLERSEGFDFAARFEWPGATNRAWTWYCRRGEHTEGKLALVATVSAVDSDEKKATYRRTEFLSYFYPNLSRGFVEARLLMTSFQWLVKAGHDLRDWSGYDLLRMDVRCDASAVELNLAVEDNVLEPPVMRTYKLPVDKWVTVELDLREAERVRQLDLAKIANFWLMARSPVRTTIRIDNIRIAKRGAPASNELLRDTSSMAVPILRPTRPEAPSIGPAAKRDRTAVKLAESIVVAQGSIVPFGWVSAYDNKRMFVAYSAEKAARAVYTNDGGLNWKQLPGATARNLDHGSARGCAIDRVGGGIAVSSGPGCAGLGNPSPRQHLTKYSFTGESWQVQPATILDSDIRHCGSNVSAVRLRGGPFKRRLWATWGQINREHAMEVHAKFSDDDGLTWIPWGKGAAIPGSQAADWSDGTYGYPETVVAPYTEHLACFWRHKRRSGVKWSFYDGSKWSVPAEISPATLDDMDGAYRATMSAITRGDREIFFTATGMKTVLRWDGRSWHTEPIEIEDGGMLCLAGDIVMLFTSGKVNRRWKGGVRWQRRTRIQCYQLLPSGGWEGPVDLTGEFTMDEYRSLAGFSVPPYSPDNFVPLAWSDFDDGTVKLLKVPAPLTIPKDSK
ncbi:MAG: hypothetical protein CEE38_05165 [Planctomycetes bacterium B3_Pla]|nr:MAG: hypothetical protein CEE38_05165 [Planctomycetes bacterium B3_Pla]